MNLSRRMMLGAVATLAAAVVAPVRAQSSRDAALHALAVRLRLPLVDEAVRIFSVQLRRTLPAFLVDAAGRQAGLGAGWRRGDAAYDEALRQLDAVLTAEEARGGPLVRIDRDDLLSAVNIPWTADDIAFVDATLDTDLGREAERALDARAAQQAIATLKRRIAVGPAGEGIAASFADLDARAQAQFGDASLNLLALKGADPERARRLQRLVEQVTLAPSDAIGQRIVDRLSRRLIDAAMRAMPGVAR